MHALFLLSSASNTKTPTTFHTDSGISTTYWSSYITPQVIPTVRLKRIVRHKTTDVYIRAKATATEDLPPSNAFHLMNLYNSEGIQNVT